MLIVSCLLEISSKSWCYIKEKAKAVILTLRAFCWFWSDKPFSRYLTYKGVSFTPMVKGEPSHYSVKGVTLCPKGSRLHMQKQ